ncbi:MAG: aspartate aminotransferase family protein [Saprospiraceae bacterium]
MHIRRQFLSRLSGTSEIPQGFIPSRALESHIYDEHGNAYLDLVSGFSVMNLGHSHPQVIQAIEEQARLYLHTNVYAEHIQSVQLELAQLLCSVLPSSLKAVYYLSSGSETIDAAIKLVRKHSGRTEIIVCSNAYHGSTLAAESLRSDMEHSRYFRPLLPDIRFIKANCIEDLDVISSKTAAVITEVVQAEAGVIRLESNFLEALRKKCTDHKVKLVFDEIQTGFGRTGTLFAFQKSGIIPDILLVGKAFGCGLPLSAVIATSELLSEFKMHPSLGYISTFGGNPLCCAAALAGLKVMLKDNIIGRIPTLINIVKEELEVLSIKEMRIEGMLIALDFDNPKLVWKIITELYKKRIMVESFLFNHGALRISPPLVIEEHHLKNACKEIAKTVNEILL